MEILQVIHSYMDHIELDKLVFLCVCLTKK